MKRVLLPLIFIGFLFACKSVPILADDFEGPWSPPESYSSSNEAAYLLEGDWYCEYRDAYGNNVEFMLSFSDFNAAADSYKLTYWHMIEGWEISGKVSFDIPEDYLEDMDRGQDVILIELPSLPGANRDDIFGKFYFWMDSHDELYLRHRGYDPLNAGEGLRTYKLLRTYG